MLPVTLIDARHQCRIDPDDTSQDGSLQGYILAAAAIAEHETGARLVATPCTQGLDAWPAGGCILLAEGPVREISAVVYTGTDGQQHTVPPETYRLRRVGLQDLLLPAYQASWPTAVRADVGAIVVTYVAGIAADDAGLPRNLWSWILAHVVAMWEVRGTQQDRPGEFQTLPHLARLLDPARRYA